MFKNEWNEVRSGWLILGAFVVVLVGQIMFTLPGVTFLNLIEMAGRHNDTPNVFLQSPFTILLTQGAGTFGGIAATFIAYRTINKKNPNKMYVQGRATDLWTGLILGALSITILFVFLYSTNQIVLKNPLSDPNITSALLVYFILFILVSLFEEILFRGYVMNTMRAKHNKKSVMYIVSALLFTFAHVFNPNLAILGLKNIFFIGLLFAYMFDRTRSLLMPIGFHFTWNFFQGSIFGFPVSGLDPHGLYKIDVTTNVPLLTGGTFGLEASILTTIIIGINFMIVKMYTKQHIRSL